MNRFSVLSASFALAALTACGGQAASTTAPSTRPAQSTAAGATVATAAGKKMLVATGSTGGVFYPLGEGLTVMLKKYLPNVEVTTQATAASVENFNIVHQRPQEVLAFAQADVAYDALEGRGAFVKDGPSQVRSLGILYLNMMQLVAKDGAGINTPADLKGKRVSVGAEQSGTEVKALRILEAYGLDPATDIQPQHLDPAKSGDAIKAGTLDAFFFDGGIPTPAIADLANTIPVKLIPHGDAVKKMNAKYGDFYAAVDLPKDTYKGMTQDVASIAGLPNILSVHEQFPEDLAFSVLTTIFDHKSEWDAIHPEAKFTELRTAWQNSPVPLHAGAIRFYQDRGVYK